MTEALKFPFDRGGFHHELVERSGLVCLVKRSKPEHWHYEVVKLRVWPAEEYFGRVYPERERYPPSEEWGTLGFTYLASDLEGARKRWRELTGAALTSDQA
jgi:hypothetical protein